MATAATSTRLSKATELVNNIDLPQVTAEDIIDIRRRMPAAVANGK